MCQYNHAALINQSMEEGYPQLERFTEHHRVDEGLPLFNTRRAAAHKMEWIVDGGPIMGVFNLKSEC